MGGIRHCNNLNCQSVERLTCPSCRLFRFTRLHTRAPDERLTNWLRMRSEQPCNHAVHKMPGPQADASSSILAGRRLGWPSRCVLSARPLLAFVSGAYSAAGALGRRHSAATPQGPVPVPRRTPAPATRSPRPPSCLDSARSRSTCSRDRPERFSTASPSQFANSPGGYIMAYSSGRPHLTRYCR